MILPLETINSKCEAAEKKTEVSETQILKEVPALSWSSSTAGAARP